MHVGESRRITGRHLLLDGPGAALELLTEPGDDVASFVERLARRAAAATARLDLPAVPLVVRAHATGVTVGVRLPVDALLTGAELLAWAAGDAPEGGDEEAALATTLAGEASATLRACVAAAGERPVLVDDEGLTVGLGRHARSWPLDALPSEDALGEGARVPVAYVTGTNGKTTTTRLLARMLAEDGRVVGHTSSDGIVVGGEVVDEGDWTGPWAARQVLRHAAVEVAVLETARGGLLRRGLVLDGVDVAVVTNVASDHLGEWGVDTVADMARVKLLVADALRPGGTLVVHGRCPALDDAIGALRARRPDVVVRAFADGPGAADLDAFADGPDLVVRTGDGELRLPASEVPITFGGTARHNVENALAAALGAHALGASGAAIAAALRSFRPDVRQSAGRMNVFRLPSGATVVVDFAHNPDGLARLVSTLSAWPARSRRLMLGQAGDRSADDLRALAAAAVALGPDRVYLKELPHKLRGAAPGAVSAALRAHLGALGIEETAMTDDTDELAATRRALGEAGEGVLLLLLVHETLPEVLAVLDAAGAVAA